jgi:transposase
MSTYTLFVGIDIAKATASVAYTAQAARVEGKFNIAQTAGGYTTLRERLLAREPNPAHILVVMEATGTYWMPLAADLYRAGFAVSVINPAQACDFARALLTRTKTDAVDARILTRLAATFQPARWTPPPPIYEELRQRLVQRDELLDLLQRTRNRDHAHSYRPQVIKPVEARTQALIDLLTEQIAALDTEIETLLHHGEWAPSAILLLSIPGVGPITAAWLLIATLNFAFADSAEQVAAYAGLVPHKRQSGTSVKSRPAIGHAGHKRLRTALYMATLSAVRHNPIICAFYYRLLERGKPTKVALCAAARKLVCIAWAVSTNGVLFDPNYQQATLAA